MLNLSEKGQPIAKIISGRHKGEIIYLSDDDPDEATIAGCQKIDLKRGRLQPILDVEKRDVSYITGPAGSGKSTYSSKLASDFRKLHPKADIYFFSRTDWKTDPAYHKIKPLQIKLDESLIENPIDCVEDIKPGSLLIFDDIGTINDDKIRHAVNQLAMDLLEVGRRQRLWVIITSHLVTGNDRKFARVVHNEYRSFTFFPRSGASYQIKYALRVYFGFSKPQIDKIMALPSRWVTVMKNYPMAVLYEHGVYLI